MKVKPLVGELHNSLLSPFPVLRQSFNLPFQQIVCEMWTLLSGDRRRALVNQLNEGELFSAEGGGSLAVTFDPSSLKDSPPITFQFSPRCTLVNRDNALGTHRGVLERVFYSDVSGCNAFVIV